MERQSTINREEIDLPIERMGRVAKRSIGRTAFRGFNTDIFADIKDSLQEMPDLYLLRLHDSVCNENEEYDYIITRVKKELARRQLEY